MFTMIRHLTWWIISAQLCTQIIKSLHRPWKIKYLFILQSAEPQNDIVLILAKFSFRHDPFRCWVFSPQMIRQRNNHNCLPSWLPWWCSATGWSGWPPVRPAPWRSSVTAGTADLTPPKHVTWMDRKCANWPLNRLLCPSVCLSL